MATVTLKIPDMTCSGCQRSVEAALTHVDGVHTAQVDLQNRQAFVEYDDAQTNPTQLAEAVEYAGYTVETD